mgnify:CR=1 FL=1
MKFVHILSRITGTPWLILEDALENITLLIESRIAGLALQPMNTPAVAPPQSRREGNAAIIPIHGVIGKKLSPMEMACGGADVDAISASLDAAVADPAVQRIILDIDSPGGQVTGVPELANKIARARDTSGKTITARSDTVIGSAAYWLAASAHEIHVTPTTQVGSIGAALTVRETIDNKSADGRTRLRVFRSGADKLPGADGPLTEQQAAAAQKRVDHIGALFRDHVAASRPRVKPESMTGSAFHGTEAHARGLVDSVSDTLSAAA